MENELSKEGICLKSKFDLKYMFTVNSEVDEQKMKVSCPLRSVQSIQCYQPPFPDGDYGSCSAITGYANGILHSVVAVKASPNLPWGLVPEEPTLVETFHPITERSFTKTDLGKYKLEAGPLCLELNGPMYYDVMSNVGMKEYPHSEYLNGNVRFSLRDFIMLIYRRCQFTTSRFREVILIPDLT